MQNIGHQCDPIGLGFPGAAIKGTMVRRGKSDELLSATERQRIDDFWREELCRLGSDFPYINAIAAVGWRSTQDAKRLVPTK